jgi:hypothetical protein
MTDKADLINTASYLQRIRDEYDPEGKAMTNPAPTPNAMELWFEQQIENAREDQIAGFAMKSEKGTLQGERAHARQCAMHEAQQQYLASRTPTPGQANAGEMLQAVWDEINKHIGDPEFEDCQPGLVLACAMIARRRNRLAAQSANPSQSSEESGK